MSGNVEFEYRRYMLRRGYARETIWARCAVAADWRRRHPSLRASHRQVEEWVAGRRISPGASRNLLTNLRAFYRWAMREGLVEVDPTALADSPRIPQRLPRPAPDDQIGAVLAVSPVDTAAMVALMAGAGLRCVEVSRLSWCDVDLAVGTVYVMGKGQRERVLKVAPDVLAWLARLDSTTGPLFTGPTGVRRSPARVSQIVCEAFRVHGWGTVAHQLRHRAATKFLAVPGTNLRAVQQLLGHASVTSTQIYTAVTPDLLAATSRALTLPGAA